MDGGEFPPEYIQFMTSSTIWGMYCTRPEHPYLPDTIKQIEQVQWPQEFENHIFAKTEELKQSLNALLVRYRAQ